MAAMIRPNTKAMKIAYKILKTPKEMQQRNDKNKLSKRIKQEMFVDTQLSQ